MSVLELVGDVDGVALRDTVGVAVRLSDVVGLRLRDVLPVRLTVGVRELVTEAVRDMDGLARDADEERLTLLDAAGVCVGVVDRDAEHGLSLPGGRAGSSASGTFADRLELTPTAPSGTMPMRPRMSKMSPMVDALHAMSAP
jgi:hypothetical protein